MTETHSVPLPYQRGKSCPFGPAEEYQRLRTEEPIVGVSLPSGAWTWLVTRHADVRRVLGDPLRFSSRRTPLAVMRPLTTDLLTDLRPPPEGSFSVYDPPQHTRLRKLLDDEFSARRMKRMWPRIERIVAERLDAMEQAGPPVDLVETFAFPVASAALCELIGVPTADRPAGLPPPPGHDPRLGSQ